ncbi:hypothetical protein [Streptomyces puniciscabiei]|uniref:hypothetical protein n=1 Tax=Streptomyces puniciscabiei TaxID=164348 RepID=UPI00332EFECE
MTRTRRTGMKARGGRLAVAGALGAASLALAAVPAYAKGDVDVTVPHTAHGGKTFTVTAHGDDDAVRYVRVCLQQRSGGHAWRQVACGAAVPSGTEARAAAHVKDAGRGPVDFRAAMYGLTGPSDHHPVRRRTSDPVTVHVR